MSVPFTARARYARHPAPWGGTTPAERARLRTRTARHSDT